MFWSIFWLLNFFLALFLAASPSPHEFPLYTPAMCVFAVVSLARFLIAFHRESRRPF